MTIHTEYLDVCDVGYGDKIVLAYETHFVLSNTRINDEYLLIASRYVGGPHISMRFSPGRTLLVETVS